MALPKIESPTFMLELPSNKKKTIKYRPFTVKEEKILLVALQSGEAKEITEAVIQIINNCVIGDLDVGSLASYDVEYIFLNLRSKSVSNLVELKITDPDDEQQYDVSVDLDKVTVQFDKNHKYEIEASKDVTILMRDPSLSLIDNIGDDDAMTDIICGCIDKVLVGDDEVVLMKEHTRQEQEDFINSLSSKTALDLQRFFATVPKLKHTLKYKDASGKQKSLDVEGLASFFI